MFLADGARPDVLNEELKKGNLPNLAKYVIEPGTNKTILTTFPSTTGPAYLPFLTGYSPGSCNVPGIRWFDKAHYAKKGWSLKSFRSYVGLETLLMARDMNKGIQTVHDIYNNSMSILSMINKGLKRGHNKTRHSRIWYYYYAHLTDRWSFVDEAINQKLLHALDGEPDFVFLVYPSIDEYSHRSSPFHPRAVQAYGDIDKLIGKVVKKLQEKGWLEETLLVLVSDHGLSETHTHFDVGPYLEEKNIKTFFYTQIFKRNFKAASMISGNGMAHLYFENEKGWGDRTTFEELSHTGVLLDEFRHRSEIDLVATTGSDNTIHLQTEAGHGFFTHNGQKIRYEWDREEPLGIFEGGINQSSGEKENSFEMTIEESMEKTWESHYPDVFYQLHQLFSSPRSGDVILSAKTGNDLRERYEHPEHKSSHGAICPEHMRIPFLMNYPVEKEFIRSVDVFPTVLKLTGKEIPEGIDGICLV